jgi:hypothetical protein
MAATVSSLPIATTASGRGGEEGGIACPSVETDGNSVFGEIR